MSNVLRLSKTSKMASKNALFGTNSKQNKAKFTKSCGTKIFIFMNCTKNLKKTKEFWPFYTFIWKNELKFDDKKVYFTVFVLKKSNIFGFFES